VKRLLAVSMAAIGASVGGCRAVSRYVWVPPTVALRNVAVEGIGLTGGTLRVSLVVRNPNFYPLNTAGLRYRLLVRESVPVAQGVDSIHAHVPAHDSAVVTLPVQVSWRGLSAAGSDVMASGLVTYRLTGEILLDTPAGVHGVPVNQSGQFAPMR